MSTRTALGHTAHLEVDGLDMAGDAATDAAPETARSATTTASTTKADCATTNPAVVPPWDWVARMRFKGHELGTSFLVWLFLGPVPADVEEWGTSPNIAGCAAAYVASGEPHMDGADREGFAHLTRDIVARSGLASLEPEAVVPYLRENLQWRVEKADDRTEAQLKSLEVVVFASPVTLPPGADIPVYGDPHFFHEITYGRPGGSRQA